MRKKGKKNFLMVKKIMASFAIYLLEIIKCIKEICQLLLPLKFSSQTWVSYSQGFLFYAAVSISIVSFIRFIFIFIVENMEKKKVNRNICFMISGKCTKIDQGTMLQTLIVTWYFCCWNIQTIPSFYVYNFLCIYVFWAGNCKLPMILFSAIIKKCLPKVTFSMYFKWLFSIYIRKRSHWNPHVSCMFEKMMLWM